MVTKASPSWSCGWGCLGLSERALWKAWRAWWASWRQQNETRAPLETVSPADAAFIIATQRHPSTSRTPPSQETCPDCKTSIEGSSCAHTLSRAEGWKNKPNCVSMCKCKYPVRAKEVRDHIFSNFIDSDQKASANAYIYCETKGDQHHASQGHVYYGTFSSCVKGNGLAASGMSSIGVFNRYKSAK